MSNSLNNARIRRETKLLAKNQYYFDRLIEKARPYLFYIIEEAEKRNIPMEIALLPALESSFDPYAYSHGKAAGLWQFLSPVGRYYGLKQNWWYDGRRDIIESTRAAFTFLQELHDNFGTWELALAAYNSGSGTVSSAIRKNKRLGKSINYWALDLPTETERYVPKVIAISKVINNPEKYGITLSPVENQPYFSIIDTKQQVDLSKIAKATGISLKELRTLNPAFNRWATAPEGPHRLLVPVKRAKEVEVQLRKLNNADQLQWTHYAVQPGDSLSSIAKRFQSSVNLITEANDLNNNNLIMLGNTLLIPTPPEEVKHTYTLSLTDKANVAHHTKSKIAADKKDYIVKKGDTLSSIARKNNIKTSELARWNQMTIHQVLKVGQKISLFEPPRDHASLHNDAVIRKIFYKVRTGDSLSKIAKKFNLQVNQIKNWNHLKSTHLKPGQNLRLYVDIRKMH